MINYSHKVITTGVETTLLCLANQAHRRGGVSRGSDELPTWLGVGHTTVSMCSVARTISWEH